jgi:hypothetical protein
MIRARRIARPGDGIGAGIGEGETSEASRIAAVPAADVSGRSDQSDDREAGASTPSFSSESTWIPLFLTKQPERIWIGSE